MQPKLIVEQKITAFTNKYTVSAANPDGSKGATLAFAQQKRMAFKEQVTFYTDESKAAIAFTMRAEKVMDIHGKFLIEDQDGREIGAFRKQFAKSLLASTWNILDSQDQPMLIVDESNKLLAALRRFAGFIPFVGEFIDILTGFIKYHFDFKTSETAEPIGKYQKTTLFRDHYTLQMTDTAYASFDWRVLAAMAVALDALQDR
jgi:uncharacterized protein YxjI